MPIPGTPGPFPPRDFASTVIAGSPRYFYLANYVNEVKNPSVEVNVGDWQTYDGVSVLTPTLITSDGFAGSSSVEVTRASLPAAQNIQIIPANATGARSLVPGAVAVGAGETVGLFMAGKVTAQVGQSTLYFVQRLYRADGTVINAVPVQSVSPVTGTWHSLYFTVVTPANTAWMTVQLLLTAGSTGTHTLRGDAAMVVKDPPSGTLAYVDGDQSGSNWAGIAHNSRSFAPIPTLEADVARALAVQKQLGVTPATEVDAAQELIPEKAPTLVPATTTDVAQALSVTKTIFKSLTPAIQTDAAQGLDTDKRATLGPSAETDSARALDASKRTALTPVVEIDAVRVLGVTHVHYRTLTPVVETDAVQILGVTHVHYRTLTPVVETDTARGLSITVVTFKSLTPVVETNVAQGLSFTKTIRKTLAPAAETNATRTLVFTHIHYRSLAPVAEADVARALAFTKRIYKVLAPGLEVDQAQAIIGVKRVALEPVVETDEAQALLVPHLMHLEPAREIDTAQILLVRVTPRLPSFGAAPVTSGATVHPETLKTGRY